jgi:hypothetical protein
MDIYAIVTEKIINLLESGVVPWRRPWTSTGMPRNLVSKKPYRGVNVFSRQPAGRQEVSCRQRDRGILQVRPGTFRRTSVGHPAS